MSVLSQDFWIFLENGKITKTGCSFSQGNCLDTRTTCYCRIKPSLPYDASTSHRFLPSPLRKIIYTQPLEAFELMTGPPDASSRPVHTACSPAPTCLCVPPLPSTPTTLLRLQQLSPTTASTGSPQRSGHTASKTLTTP